MRSGDRIPKRGLTAADVVRGRSIHEVITVADHGGVDTPELIGRVFLIEIQFLGFRLFVESGIALVTALGHRRHNIGRVFHFTFEYGGVITGNHDRVVDGPVDPFVGQDFPAEFIRGRSGTVPREDGACPDASGARIEKDGLSRQFIGRVSFLASRQGEDEACTEQDYSANAFHFLILLELFPINFILLRIRGEIEILNVDAHAYDLHGVLDRVYKQGLLESYLRRMDRGGNVGSFGFTEFSHLLVFSF